MGMSGSFDADYQSSSASSIDELRKAFYEQRGVEQYRHESYFDCDDDYEDDDGDCYCD